MGNWPARHDLSCWQSRKPSKQTNKRLCHVWFCHAWFFCLHWHYKIMCDFFSRLYTWEKKMEEDNIAVSLCIIIIASAILRIRRDRRRPMVWARSWIRRRARYGAHHSLIKELSSEDPKGFKNFIRMDTNDSEELLANVTPCIYWKKGHTWENLFLLLKDCFCYALFGYRGFRIFGPRQANLVLIAYASSEGSGEPAHPRSLARTSAARSYKQWVKRNIQTESQIPGPSEWLGMRS